MRSSSGVSSSRYGTAAARRRTSRRQIVNAFVDVVRADCLEELQSSDCAFNDRPVVRADHHEARSAEFCIVPVSGHD